MNIIIIYFERLVDQMIALFPDMSLQTAGLGPRCIKINLGRSIALASGSLLVPQQTLRCSQHGSKIAVRLQSSRRCLIASSNKSRTSTSRSIQTQSFQSFVPPPPESLGKAAPPKLYPRSIRWGRRLLYVSAVGGVLYLFDTQFYASSISRSMRTFGLGLLVAADYKLNFRPKPFFGGDITNLHRRNAERLFNLLHQNGGLYLKIGQAIAMQSAVLPPEFQKMFARMFDDAPQNDWKDVERVIREDFGGRSPEEVFGVSFSNESGKGIMEKKARASASVAQVHWARLTDGREVAIKVQKREIAQQVGWDLWAFKSVQSLISNSTSC